MTPNHQWAADELRASVGTVLNSWRAEVDRSSIRAFARAVGHVDPVFFDVRHARSLGHPDLPMPPGMVPMPVYQPGEPLYPIPLVVKGTDRRLNAGTELHQLTDGYPGEYLATHELLEVFERDGGLGHMFFTVSAYRYRTLDGVQVLAKIHTSICY